MTAFEALTQRRSVSKVGSKAPTHAELLRFVEAAGTVADHSGLRPWRLIELRGDALTTLGEGLAAAQHASGGSREKAIAKARRAPLVIAVVAVRRPSGKVPVWEQDAVAAGVAHTLSLVLDEAGWGVMWRTGESTREKAVREAHKLAPNEELMGWLYIGDTYPGDRGRQKPRINPSDHLSEL